MAGQIFVVDKRQYYLYRYRLSERTKQYERRARFRVALGMDQYPTPSGVFRIGEWSLNPDWQMPDSDWVPEQWRGKIIPGGDPNNPLKGAFLDFGFLGIGIHGTDQLDSLGTKASHGCIRVKPEVAVKLTTPNPTGTPVVIL